MTPFKPGDRVIVRIPEPVVGVVRGLTPGGDVVVDAGGTTGTISASDVVPAMPRDRGDIDKYGRLWWWGGEVVDVWIRRDGVGLYRGVGDTASWRVRPESDWRGPVGSPPEVKP